MNLDQEKLLKKYKKILKDKFADIKFWYHSDGIRLSDACIMKIIGLDKIPIGDDFNYFSDNGVKNGPFKRNPHDTKKYRSLEAVLYFIIYSVMDDTNLGNLRIMQNTNLDNKKCIIHRNVHYVIDYHKPLGIYYKFLDAKDYSDQVIILTDIIEYINEKYEIRGECEYDSRRWFSDHIYFRFDYFIKTLYCPIIIEVNEQHHHEKREMLNDFAKMDLESVGACVIMIDTKDWYKSNDYKRYIKTILDSKLKTHKSLMFIEKVKIIT